MNHRPLLAIVTGRPGAGKTTLAKALGAEIHCPVLCRDEFKEGYVNTAHSSHAALGREVNLGIYKTFFATVELLLRNGISLVAESAFQHKLWAPKLEPLLDLVRVRVVICAVDPQLARARFLARGQADPERVRFHGDKAVHAAQQGIALPVGPYDPPRLPVPTLNVDTTDQYKPSLPEIVQFVREP